VTEDWVFLGLGSNLGDRAGFLDRGFASLERGGFSIRRRSSVYETEPVGFESQPWFLNAVVAGETRLPPRALFALAKQIEAACGRVATVPLGPRTLDIDLLLYKGEVIEEPDLVVPHPRLRERRFVLVPLLEIAPGIRDPRDGCPLAEVLAGLDEEKAVTRSRQSRS
jgi:2-amino-4-hydroxy-6-hydroxymethyldihydropteridine diphosphokinase